MVSPKAHIFGSNTRFWKVIRLPDDELNSLMDEDTRHFLNMLDATAERVFEAYTKDSLCLQQGKELGPQLSWKNTFHSSSDISTSLDEPQNRRNRRRISEQLSFQQVVADNQFTSGLGDKIPSLNRENHFVSWPLNFTFQSNTVNKSVGGFDTKHSSFSVKDHCQLPKKTPSTIRRNVSNTGVFDLDRTNVGTEKKDLEKPVDFSKEIEDAISRIESLIPSLQKLVNSVHSPKQKSADNLGLPNIYGSVTAGQEKDWVITKNEIGLTGKSAALGDNTVGKQVAQTLTTCNLPVPSQVKWSRNVSPVDGEDDDDLLKQFKNIEIGRSNVNKTQRLVDEPLNFNVQISQVPVPKFEAGMGTSESLKGTPSRNRSFASHKPVHIQGSRVIPRQSFFEEAIEKDVNSRPCTQAPSVGSTKFMSHNGTSMGDPSQQKRSQSHTIMSSDSLNRHAAIMKNMNEASHSKVVSHDQPSEDTSWSSCASSSATTEQSGSPYSSSGTYMSSETDYYDSDESEPRHEIVSRSTRRRPADVVTKSSASSYDTNSSYYDSREEYSDVGSSSPMSSAQSHEWVPRKERRRKKGRLKRLGKKLGVIFHHPRHHHHYSDKDNGPDVRHARSLWARLGDMFHNTKKDNDQHHKPPKVEKPRKSETKTLAKRKQQRGHFDALVGGLMKHMKQSKKPKQVKNGMKGLGHDRRKGKKLPWLPKIHGGRGGVKISNNKGKAKLGNYYRTKSMAAAKLILGK